MFLFSLIYRLIPIRKNNSEIKIFQKSHTLVIFRINHLRNFSYSRETNVALTFLIRKKMRNLRNPKIHKTRHRKKKIIEKKCNPAD